jgi:hypothetical protein
MNTVMLRTRQQSILRELDSIQSMKRGTISYQRRPSARSQSERVYPVLTWKEENKTKSMRLKTEAEVAWAKQAIANYRRFAELVREYEQIAEQLALAQRSPGEATSLERVKKKPRLRSRRTPK